jgi:polyisoprenoid-binding protein YceI
MKPRSRRHLCWLAVLSCLLGADLAAQVRRYSIAPAEGARFALEVAKTRLMSGKVHLFLFHRYSGLLAYDAASPEQSQVEFSVESDSLECKDTWVSATDLQKIVGMARHDMLAVEKHAALTFASSRVRQSGQEQFEVEGQLTIRGIARPALVRVQVTPAEGGDLLLDGRSTVKMKDYGLKPPSAALGMVGTKDEMEVSFVLRARSGSQ